MKNVFLWIVCFFGTISFAQLDVKSFSHDFGEILESNGPVRVQFPIKNPNEETIFVIETESSCGCTSFVLEGKELTPGKTFNLNVEYNPKDRFGRFHKSVKVVYIYKHTLYEVLFTVRGNVLKSKNENQVSKIKELKIQPFTAYAVSEYDTSYVSMPSFEEFINALTYEIDAHGFATLGVDHASYTLSNKDKMDFLIMKMKKRIAKGLEERGYKSYNINYKTTEFDFNFIPKWAMSKIRLYSVKYTSDLVYFYEVKKDLPKEEKDNRFKYVDLSGNIDQYAENELLSAFFEVSDLKLMINDTIDVDIEMYLPFSYAGKVKKIKKVLMSKINKNYKYHSGFEISSFDLKIATDTAYSFKAYQKIALEKGHTIKYIPQEVEIKAPLLPMAHYNFDFDAVKVIDTSNVDMKRLLENTILHMKKGRRIVFNIESSVSNYPNKMKQTPVFFARQNSRKATEVIHGFMKSRGIEQEKYDIIQLPLVQGPEYSKKYSKTFYKRFEYLNVIPTFEKVDTVEISQTKYKVNYNSNSFTLDSNATMFKVFMKGIIAEINEFGFSKIILESSSSKAPTRTKNNLSNEVISYKRAEEARDIMKNYLHRAGIDPNRLILIEERCLVQGPEYKLDYFENKEKYKKYQYIKIIPQRLLSE